MALGFLERTAGFEDFLRKTERKPFGEKSALDKFSDLMTESREQGTIQAGDQASQIERELKDSALAQLPQQETPFRETILGGLTSAFIPGASGVFRGQERREQQEQQQQKQSALAQIMQDPNLSPQQKISSMASIDLPSAKQFAELQRPAVTKLSENERQAQALMERGMSKTDAENIANGFVKPITNPVTGETELVDLTTGKTKPLSISDQQESPDEEKPIAEEISLPPVPSLYDQADLATGAESAFLSGISGVTGQVGLPVAKDTIRARQDLKTAGQSLTRSLIVGDRFTATEMKEIKKEVDLEPSVFDSGKALRQRMISIDRSLRNRLAKQEKAANDRTLPVKTRQTSATNANSIRNFLDTLAVPVQVKSVVDAEKLTSGTRFIDPNGIERIVP